MINIKTLKNYIHRNLQDKYYQYIRQNIPDNKDKFLDAKINVTSITKNNKIKYIEYTLTIVTEYKELDESDILAFLEPAEKLINTYLKKSKHFRKNNKLKPFINNLYAVSYNIRLTKDEALGIYALLKLTEM